MEHKVQIMDGTGVAEGRRMAFGFLPAGWEEKVIALLMIIAK